MKNIFPKSELTHIFNKFVNTEIKSTRDLEPIEAEAKKNGLTLRVWYPNTMGTMDWRPNRLNIHVEQDTDKKWRINNNFTLG